MVKISSFPFRLTCTSSVITENDTEFVWMPVHQQAFDQLKLHVSNDVKLQFYDASKPLYIEVDTSKKGIGAVMLQEDPIVKDGLKAWQ